MKTPKGTNARKVNTGITGKYFYRINRNKQKHLFRNYNGYALNVKVLSKLMMYEKVGIHIGVVDLDKTYYLLSPLEEWFSNGINYPNKLNDGSIEPQLVLPVNYMIKLEEFEEDEEKLLKIILDKRDSQQKLK